MSGRSTSPAPLGSPICLSSEAGAEDAGRVWAATGESSWVVDHNAFTGSQFIGSMPSANVWEAASSEGRLARLRIEDPNGESSWRTSSLQVRVMRNIVC